MANTAAPTDTPREGVGAPVPIGPTPAGPPAAVAPPGPQQTPTPSAQLAGAVRDTSRDRAVPAQQIFEQLSRIEDKTARIEDKYARSESLIARMEDKVEASNQRMNEAAKQAEVAALRSEVRALADRTRRVPGAATLLVMAIVTAVLTVALFLAAQRFGIPGLMLR